MDLKINNKTLVIFDLDDTLYKEIDFLRSAYRSIAKHYFGDRWEACYLQMFSEFRRGEDVFQNLQNRSGIHKDELIRMYREHIPDISTSPGALELIRALVKNKASLGLLTDGRSVTQRNKIEKLGINPYFDFILISEETGYDKYHEHNFKLIADKFPEHGILYIADNVRKDFKIPNGMGWQTIGILDNGQNIHTPEFPIEDQALPQHWVWDLMEIRIL